MSDTIRERPILMRGPLVRATMEDRKWKTRRVVVPTMTPPRVAPLRMEPWIIDGAQETDDNGSPLWAGFHPDYPGEAKWFSCPYGKVGDRLWVRETFARLWFNAENGWETVYRADDNLDCVLEAANGNWKPSIHMPRTLSRLTLEITDIQVEQIQDTSLDDMRAEGVRPDQEVSLLWRESLRENFVALWDSINAKRGYGWAVNPWVWVVSYTRVPQ